VLGEVEVAGEEPGSEQDGGEGAPGGCERGELVVGVPGERVGVEGGAGEGVATLGAAVVGRAAEVEAAGGRGK